MSNKKADKGANASRRINCFDCLYMHITWQPAHPYGCRAIGFKSKVLPSLEVFKNSGSPCMHFSPKQKG